MFLVTSSFLNGETCGQSELYGKIPVLVAFCFREIEFFWFLWWLCQSVEDYSPSRCACVVLNLWKLQVGFCINWICLCVENIFSSSSLLHFSKITSFTLLHTSFRLYWLSELVDLFLCFGPPKQEGGWVLHLCISCRQQDVDMMISECW